MLPKEDFTPSLRHLIADYDRQIAEAENAIEKLKALRAAALVLLENEEKRAA